MALILNDISPTTLNPLEDWPDEQQRDIRRLARYLAVIEDNKKASLFVPNDALVALDMAGYALGKVSGSRNCVPVSAARLALALVQPTWQAPLQ